MLPLAVQVETWKVPAVSDEVYFPIDPSSFAVPTSARPLQLSVASITAQCRASNGCAYAASDASTPTVSSAVVSASDGRHLVITGAHA